MEKVAEALELVGELAFIRAKLLCFAEDVGGCSSIAKGAFRLETDAMAIELRVGRGPSSQDRRIQCSWSIDWRFAINYLDEHALVLRGLLLKSWVSAGCCARQCG